MRIAATMSPPNACAFTSTTTAVTLPCPHLKEISLLLKIGVTLAVIVAVISASGAVAASTASAHQVPQRLVASQTAPQSCVRLAVDRVRDFAFDCFTKTFAAGFWATTWVAAVSWYCVDQVKRGAIQACQSVKNYMRQFDVSSPPIR